MMTSQDQSKEASLSASPQAPSSSKALFDKFDFSLDPSTFDLDTGFDIHPHHAESVAELMNKPHDTPVKPSLASIEHSPNHIAPHPPSPNHDSLPFGAYANYQFGNYLIQMPLPEPDRFRIAPRAPIPAGSNDCMVVSTASTSSTDTYSPWLNAISLTIDSRLRSIYPALLILPISSNPIIRCFSLTSLRLNCAII